MGIIQGRRARFDELHRAQGGLDRFRQLLEDYIFTYEDIAEHFGFVSGKIYIGMLLQRLDLDGRVNSNSKRTRLTLQERRDNFDRVYGDRGGITRLVEMLKVQASDKEIAEQFAIAEKRAEHVLWLLGLQRRNFKIRTKPSHREYFDVKYQNKGGIARLEQMAQDDQVSLQDIAKHFGYQTRSGISHAIKRMGLKYISKRR